MAPAGPDEPMLLLAFSFFIVFHPLSFSAALIILYKVFLAFLPDSEAFFCSFSNRIGNAHNGDVDGESATVFPFVFFW